MKYYIETAPIDNLEISGRTYNTLKREGINHIKHIVELDVDTASEFSGKKAITNNISSDKVLLDVNFNKTFYDTNGLLCVDILIEELDLPVRAYNCLKRESIYYVSEILDYDIEKLCKIKNLGHQTAEIVYSSLQSIKFQKAPAITNGEVIDSCMLKANKFLNILYSEQQAIASHFITLVTKIYENNSELSINDTITQIFEQSLCNEDFRNILKRSIIERAKTFEYGCSRKELLSPYNEIFKDKPLNIVFGELLSERKLNITKNGVELTYPSIEDYVSSLEEGDHKIVLEGRLHGETLEEIGNKIGCTRERIRQKEVKALSNISRVREDRYQQLFLEYSLNEMDFCFGFNENSTCYNYLSIKYKQRCLKPTPIEQLEDDQRFPLEFRLAANKIAHRYELCIDGVYVYKSRPEIANFIARTYCREKTKFTDFVEYYNMLIEDFDLSNDPKFKLSARTYENKLAKMHNILWNTHKYFRYYAFESYDFKELLGVLNLEQYNNVEYSTLKFFRDYPVLMKEYDIRDEYELHNLLKKIGFEDNNKIDFKRMPHIVFGIADRTSQVYDLLLQCASDKPISIDAFALQYEEEYGVKAKSVKANYLSCIDKYLNKGIYKIQVRFMDEDKFEYLSSALKKDYYSIKDIKSIFLSKYPNADLFEINAFTIKKLGFNIFKDYIISNKYRTATDYFHSLLSADMFKIKDFERSIVYNGTFSHELYRQKENYDIIECNPGEFISLHRLGIANITKSDLKNFVNAVYDFVSPNKYFTIKSVVDEGFDHELFDLGFDNWFYASLITEDKKHFSYGKLGSTKVFVSGRREISFPKFIEDLVVERDKIEVDDLIDLLKEKFGCKVNHDKLVEIAKDTKLYYNRIMDTAYSEYETFLEEI